MVCTVAFRFDFITSELSLRANFIAFWLNSGKPTIPAYSLSSLALTISSSAARTLGKTNGLPLKINIKIFLFIFKII